MRRRTHGVSPAYDSFSSRLLMLYPFGAIPPEFSNHLNKFESQPDASDPLREVKTSAAR